MCGGAWKGYCNPACCFAYTSGRPSSSGAYPASSRSSPGGDYSASALLPCRYNGGARRANLDTALLTNHSPNPPQSSGQCRCMLRRGGGQAQQRLSRGIGSGQSGPGTRGGRLRFCAARLQRGGERLQCLGVCHGCADLHGSREEQLGFQRMPVQRPPRPPSPPPALLRCSLRANGTLPPLA